MPRKPYGSGDGADSAVDILSHYYQQKLEQLTQARRGVADSASRLKSLQLRINASQQHVKKLESQRQMALSIGRKDLAAEAEEFIKTEQRTLEQWKTQFAPLEQTFNEAIRTSQLLQRRYDALRFAIDVFKASRPSPVTGNATGRQESMSRATASRLAMLEDILPAGIRHSSYRRKPETDPGKAEAV